MGRGPDPTFMLYSEHKMILGSQQERYDATRLLERRLYWQKGFTAAIWAIGFAAFGAFLTGLNLNLWSF